MISTPFFTPLFIVIEYFSFKSMGVDFALKYSALLNSISGIILLPFFFVGNLNILFAPLSCSCHRPTSFVNILITFLLSTLIYYIMTLSLKFLTLKILKLNISFKKIALSNLRLHIYIYTINFGQYIYISMNNYSHH